MTSADHTPTPRYHVAPPGTAPDSAADMLRRAERVAGRWESAGGTDAATIERLRRIAVRLCAEAGEDESLIDHVALLLGNAVWRDAVAAVPFERRLLLLPQCLRDRGACPAETDEFGLLCRNCGGCDIGALQSEAEALGYVVLVAEGTTAVTSLIATRRIDAIVGVSCMSVLERVFPHVLASGTPGLAVPLLRDGCDRTAVDVARVRDAMRLTSGADSRDPARPMDALRREVLDWFTPEALADICGPTDGRTDEIAREWLAAAGKRWRPFLSVGAWRALTGGEEPVTPGVRKLAVAVECFHKASLVHDDIEDDEATRYGRPALHRTYNLPVALNAGDFLIGEGYRLIGELDVPGARRAEMLRVAADAHRRLCRGQGEELWWAHRPGPLSRRQVVDIFRGKTSPSFEVALRLGAIHAGANGHVGAVLRQFSDALGVAYQIRDDLADLDGPDGDLRTMRVSLPLAIARRRARGRDRELLDALWRRRRLDEASLTRVREALDETGACRVARRILRLYARAASAALDDLGCRELETILRSVVGAIFRDAEGDRSS